MQLGDIAPDFEAETTEGPINFHDWIGDSWAVLFSHPKAFTPVCTTELGYMAHIKPEFDRRGVKIIGLSVDPLAKQDGWAKDIEETQGDAPNYPIIADADFKVSKLYGMLGADVSGDPSDRTAADNQTVRNVFVIGPDKKIKLILVYPMTTGRNFDEVLRVVNSLQLTAKHKVSTPVNWKQGEDVIIAGSVNNDQAEGALRELGGAEALHPDRPAAEIRRGLVGFRVVDGVAPGATATSGAPHRMACCAAITRPNSAVARVRNAVASLRFVRSRTHATTNARGDDDDRRGGNQGRYSATRDRCARRLAPCRAAGGWVAGLSGGEPAP